MLKKYSQKLIVNDLENYSYVINSCYLTNKSDYPEKICTELRNQIIDSCKKNKISGIISQNYSPKDDNNIQKGERVFYTKENAFLIDTYRTLIDQIVTKEELKKFLTQKEYKIYDAFKLIISEHTIDNFVVYLDQLVDLNSPKVIILVGSKHENYDHLSEYIETKYNDKIYRGLKIVYRNKVYDFSLSERNI
jgi:hypothetical protein